MPNLYMLIGVPASGKSTWIANQNFDISNTVVISSDNIIERKAAERGLTYSDVFQDEVKAATAEMNDNLKTAISQRKNIIWDQTNLTAKTRKSKLAVFPEDYEKIAVFFNTPNESEWHRRLSSRPGKTIPMNVLIGMKSQLEKPSLDEGFIKILQF